jgi:hypothetical protein
MPRGVKSSDTSKQKRGAETIEVGHEERRVPEAAKPRARLAGGQQTGNEKSGSVRGKTPGRVSAKRSNTGRKTSAGGKTSAGRKTTAGGKTSAGRKASPAAKASAGRKLGAARKPGAARTSSATRARSTSASGRGSRARSTRRPSAKAAG